MKKYSFVINTYPREDREKDLIATLDSIFSQTFKGAFEVVVVENFSSDKFIKPLLKEYKNINLVVGPKKRLSYLFNLGWRASEGENICFVADDVTLDKNWLENISGDSVDILTGPITSSCFPAGEMHRLHLLVQRNFLLKVLLWPYFYFSFEDSLILPGKLFDSGAYSYGASLLEASNFPRQEIDLATTSSMCVKRNVLEKLNGFDESFAFNHADGDFFIRAKRLGFKIIFNPKVRSVHHVRLGPSRDPYYIGLDTALFYKKDIRPKTLRGLIGSFFNLLVLNLYWFFIFITSGNKKHLRGPLGFFKGMLKLP